MIGRWVGGEHCSELHSFGFRFSYSSETLLYRLTCAFDIYQSRVLKMYYSAQQALPVPPVLLLPPASAIPSYSNVSQSFPSHRHFPLLQHSVPHRPSWAKSSYPLWIVPPSSPPHVHLTSSPPILDVPPQDS